MKKKVIIILIVLVIIFFIVFNLTSSPLKVKTKFLKDNNEYKNVKISDIKDIHVNNYTESGLDSNIVTNKKEIKELYEKLINIKYGNETKKACEDNSVIYIINLKNGKYKTVTIECDWIIIGEKRFEIIK